MSWTMYPITALIECNWETNIKPYLDKNVAPNPYHIELMAICERVYNYGCTGNARVLPKKLMDKTWTSLALVEQGFPMLWPGLSFGADSKSPIVHDADWPVHPVTRYPLVASQRVQEFNFGKSQWEVSSFSVYFGLP